MNEYQAKLLEIAKEYLNVCKKLNLRCFASGGTALGAVRHKGFIPWDDDMDFYMLREDYDQFMQRAQELLPKNLFIQNYNTDKEWTLPFAKIRDSNTTAIQTKFKKRRINHGLWIDIFPIDNIPDNKKQLRHDHWIDSKIYIRRFLPEWYNGKSFKTKIANFIVKVLLPSKRIALKKSIKLTLKYNNIKCKYVWNNLDARGKYKIERIFFDTVRNYKFEDIEIPTFGMVEEYLEAMYGDWKQLPPVEKRVPVHDVEVISFTKSYKEFLK